MFVHPDIDPVAVAIGPLAVHWYGLMYLLSFLIGWGLGILRTRQPHVRWQREEVGDLLFYVVLGVVIGGRVGYMLFYQPGLLLENPLQLFYIWQGGMSFHGGMLGVFAAAGWFARATQRTFFDITDFVAPIVPVGLFFGRIANFINGELIGRVTDVPWAMIYPRVDMAPRHPSELYEAALEGLLLFAVLWWFASKPRPRMAVSGLFLVGYGSLRFFAEFFRLPDAFLGFVAFDWMTMGQLLSTPMILGGILLLVLAYRRPQRATP
ncbi:prolipoprotein diacylglyceryl transferase [Salinisphaera sp. T5B8]|jgi:phosphatidylglycerol:prolipoprotein diacylglycerol transferase|uniref:prolipoprotein diacylglyceryl transferase n=1 Tax=Salinisphaera sp. T5B8 TaxID=1304154 RepID=UPI0002120E25